MNPNTDNPLFQDRKELLERQSQEYKNALMGEVHELRDKSQEVGKKVLIAGGALVVTYILAKALVNRNKTDNGHQKLLVYKGKKNKKKKLTEPFALYDDLSPNAGAFDVSDAHYADLAESHAPGIPQQQLASKNQPVQQKESLAKDIMGILGRHLTAYLIILGTRKLDEYLDAHKNANVSASEPAAGNTAYSYGSEPTYTSAAASDIQSAVAE